MQVDAWFKAVSQGKLETLTLLLEDGVGVDVVNPSIHSRTALHVAIDLGASASVIKFLLDEGADVNARDDRGISPLQFASAVGNLPIVEMLLDRGAHVNVCDNFGFSPLHSAVFFGRLHVIDKLVAVGANVLAATKSGATPLSLAELSGNFVLVGKLRSNQKKIEVEVPKPEKTETAKKPSNDDLPELEPLVEKRKDVKKASKVNSKEIVDINVDTEWSPTDTYGSLKKKLELANKIIAHLKSKN